MIKKLICCIFCFAFTLSIAFATECPDHFMETTEPTGYVELRYYDDNGHKWYRMYHTACFTCGETGEIGIYMYTEPHTWVYTDAGHIPGKLKHSRLKTCNGCDKTINEWLDCDGSETGVHIPIP